MKFFDYIFIRGCRKAYEKTKYKNPFEGEDRVHTLIGLNIGVVSYFVYTFFYNYDSSTTMMIPFVIGSFLAAYIITYFMYSYKSRYKKVIRKYYNKDFPKTYYYGMWTYRILSYSACIVIMIFTVEYEYNELENHSVYARAIITDTDRSFRNYHYFTFDYIADGKVYSHDQKYSPWENRGMRIGDTCSIIYSRSKPGISKALETPRGVILLIKNYGIYKPKSPKADSIFMHISNDF